MRHHLHTAEIGKNLALLGMFLYRLVGVRLTLRIAKLEARHQ
jgi:hypothetical protein